MDPKLKDESDFSGYATRANMLCSDGRTIKPNAFKHNDGAKVPLMWSHQHNSAENVLGHGYLESREDGMFVYGKFNDTRAGNHAKNLVLHGDITALSIFANGLRQDGGNVIHGDIREVSLVMAGANPGAYITDVSIGHSSDGQDFEAIICSGLSLIHADAEEEEDDTEDSEESDGVTYQDVLDTLTDEQKDVVALLIDEAVELGKTKAMSHSEDSEDEEESEESEETETDEESDKSEQDETEVAQKSDLKHSQAGNEMSPTIARNVFETTNAQGGNGTLSHAEFTQEVFTEMKRIGSLKEATNNVALAHGITDIEVLFPDAKAVSNEIHVVGLRTEWVKTVLAGVHKTPFAKIKSFYADVTHEEARARGYIKSTLKEEEYFEIAKRVTEPATIYKLQKLDRDDVIDITDFDVVSFLKSEMRVKIDEEFARAILIGDGRSNGDKFKIKEDRIRPIAKDHELYQTTLYVNIDDEGSTADEIIDALILQRHHYRGSGSPTLFISDVALGKLLNDKDGLGRRKYTNLQELATIALAKEIVAVDAFTEDETLVGIYVDLRDYTVGANKGGELNFFDDFDLDFNKYEYLMEARPSGALTRPKAALVIRKVPGSSVIATPTEPEFEGNTITVPTVTGVTYKNKLTNAAITEPVTLTSGQTVTVIAVPSSSAYYFATNTDTEWSYSFEG